ncbi:MAG: TetR/AcrR family transcriptional regulator [Halioglobus sp.]|nr:TetR/AcrR family transcriptional regulator [Halioglobus sp.]
MAVKRGPYDSDLQRQRRSQILLNTRELLESEGIEGISMARIAKMSSVSTKTLYNIFVNREGLLLQAAANRLDEMVASASIQIVTPGIPRLLAITELAMMPFRDNPDFMKTVVAIVIAANENTPGAGERVGRVQMLAYKALVVARENDELKSGVDLQELSLIIAANQWGVALMWQQNMISLEQLIRQSNLNHVITLIPFCTDGRRQWLEERMDTFQHAITPVIKQPIRLSS